MMKTHLLALALLVGSATFVSASDDHIVQPFALHSPDGALELEVAPLEASNFAGAAYRLLRGDEVVWEGTRPFTLDIGVLSDEGLVFGSALTRKDGTGKPQLTIWRIDATGAARVLDAIDRHAPWMPHGARGPWALQVWLDPEGRRAKAVLGNLLRGTGQESWTFDLDSGERLTEDLQVGVRTEQLWSSDQSMRRRTEVPDAPAPVTFAPALLGKTRLFASLDSGSDGELGSEAARKVLALAPRAGGKLDRVTLGRTGAALWLERLDAEGHLVGEAVPLDFRQSFRPMLWSPADAGEWLVATRASVPVGCMRLRWLGADGQTLGELRSYDLPTIDALESLGGERFVALGSRVDRHSRARSLVLGVYTRSGELVWEQPLEGAASGEPLLASQLALRREAPNGAAAPARIFVLRSPARKIEVFSLDGKRMGQLELPPSAPSPLVSITATADGGLLVGGFTPADELLYLDAQALEPEADTPVAAKRISLEIPTGANALALARNLVLDPDGALWSTDGQLIVRFDAQGAVTRRLGAVRAPQLPTTRITATIDSAGWVWVRKSLGLRFFGADPATGAVRVLDLPSDQELAPVASPRPSTTATGHVLVARYSSAPILARRGASLLFAPTDELIDVIDHGLLAATAVLGPAGLLVGIQCDASRNANVLTYLDSEFELLAQNNRRPNGDFFGNEYGSLDDLMVDRGGTIAVLEDDLISFTTTELSGGSIVRLPSSSPDLLALAAPWALVSWNNTKQLIHIDSGRFFAVTAPTELEGRRIVTTGLAPAGDELWYVTAEPLELWRYSLPTLP